MTRSPRREHSGRTMALVSNDAPMLADFFYSTVVLGLGSCVALISAVGLMLQLNWQLALMAGIALASISSAISTYSPAFSPCVPRLS